MTDLSSHGRAISGQSIPAQTCTTFVCLLSAGQRNWKEIRLPCLALLKLFKIISFFILCFFIHSTVTSLALFPGHSPLPLKATPFNMKSSSSTGRLLSLLTLALSLPTVLGARLKVEDFESPALARRYNSGKPRQAAKRATTSTCSAEDTTTSSGSEINTSTKELWQPAVGTAWQIVLQNPLALPASGKKFSPNVPVWDIDLFTNDADVFSALKAENKKIICYFSAGSYEPYRSDSSSFKSSDMGSSLDGWEDEKWLKLSSSNVRAIMKKRIQLAASKGCDAIDPDNVDGYVSHCTA